eukprot:XP_001705683.1 Hypothetical protein GL50803_35818 [Giardia lamblia ATCC 50803]
MPKVRLVYVNPSVNTLLIELFAQELNLTQKTHLFI